MEPPAFRLLLVHAHPDDETLTTGATMARYAAAGAGVTLVTCTRGEEGEILLPELAALGADREDRLGEHRVGELAAAMRALGVRDHRFLGGAGRWRDSGMMGTPANEAPGCFWRADIDEAVAALVAVLREVRPQVVVTYDSFGGYGHPDHIQAHRVTTAAVQAAAQATYTPALGGPWAVAKLYHTAVPRSLIQAGIDHFRAQGAATEFLAGVQSAADVPFALADELVTTQVDARDYLGAKRAALRAHASQVALDGVFFALADGVAQQAFGVEYFVLAAGTRGPLGPSGREEDLFAGVSATARG